MSSIEAYTTMTSVFQGDTISFCVSNSPNSGMPLDFTVTINPIDSDYFAGRPTSLLTAPGRAGYYPYSPMAYATGCGWPVGFELVVGEDWESGLYLALLTNADGAQAAINFIVKSSDPGASAGMLLCWPVTTCQAYNGTGGKSLYPTESNERYHKVSFDRGTDWGNAHALPFWQWILTEGYDFDACTSMDLHQDPGFLSKYQLLVSFGHDEYWSKEMRDNVEAFVANGGNVAFFSGNTCWWQVRFEDDDRTMVCYKSALDDPLTGTDNDLVTTNWASAPVNRPENTLTGVSYRTGAQASAAPPYDSYQVLDADHWVFAKTGLKNGDSFATGALGYETDAAELETIGGVTRPTGRDGTPLNFLPLASADLRSWRDDKTGGWATMGLYVNVGAVFTAGTIDWANALNQEATAQVTRNVIERLSEAYDGDVWQLRTNPSPGDDWELIGPADGIVTMTGMIEGCLFAVNRNRDLLWRPANGENVEWEQIGDGSGIAALTAPLVGAVQLLAATDDNQILGRPPVGEDVPWHVEYDAPEATVGLAWPNAFYAVTGDGLLLWRADEGWREIGTADGVVALAWWDSKLFALTNDNRILAREAVIADVAWEDIGDAPGKSVALGAYYGALFVATEDGQLWWKSAMCDPAPLNTGQLLFYNAKTGHGAIGTFDSKGYFVTSQFYPDESAGNDGFSVGWTSIVDAGEGQLLFYDSGTGKAVAGQLAVDSTFQPLQLYPDPSNDIPPFSPNWSHLAGLGDGRVLFYDTSTGKGATGFLDENGAFETWQQYPDPSAGNESLSPGWTRVVSVGGMVLFYNAQTGTGAVATVDEDGQLATIAYYPDAAAGHDSFSKGWTHVVSGPDGLLFFYSSDSGSGVAGAIDSDGSFSTLQYYPDPDDKVPFASTRWPQVVSGCNGLLLFYDSETGQAGTGGLTLEGRFASLQTYAPGSFSQSWTHIVGTKPS